MQETSALYKTILNNPNHWFESKLTIDTGIETATLNEQSIMSMQSNDEVFPNGTPQVGYAISAQLDTVIIRPNFTIPRAAKIRPYVRACSDYGDRPGAIAGIAVAGLSVVGISQGLIISEWLPKGVFYIDTRRESVNVYGPDTISIHAYDGMMKFDIPYPSDNSASYPKKDTDMVAFLAASVGVGVDIRNAEVMTRSYYFPLLVGYTAREVLGFIAGAYGGNFIMNENGELRLIKLRDLPKNMSTLTAPNGDYLLFGDTRILLFAGSN